MSIFNNKKDIELSEIKTTIASINEYYSIMSYFIKRYYDNVKDSLTDLKLSDSITSEMTQRAKRVIDDDVKEAISKASRLIAEDNKKIEKKLIESIKSKTKKDVELLVEGSYNERLREHIEQNATLITNVSDELQKKVAYEVSESIINNNKGGLLSKIKNIVKSSLKRAKLIANHQLNMIAEKSTQYRMDLIGVYHYRWVTRKDNKVRDSHKRLHNTIHDVRDKNSGDDGKAPKERINCRCKRVWIIKGEV